ncbi:uncharacterized protein LOC131927582 [Physella acuta]|uniref:uncharacterized protein LOC131927582 n=1 Tax=Physella acuta TaxID=109671 RepID=UPI0027DCCFAA|nr:uncharacterized protein LOC131927582 [Physella acuta]
MSDRYRTHPHDYISVGSDLATSLSFEVLSRSPSMCGLEPGPGESLHYSDSPPNQLATLEKHQTAVDSKLEDLFTCMDDLKAEVHDLKQKAPDTNIHLDQSEAFQSVKKNVSSLKESVTDLSAYNQYIKSQLSNLNEAFTQQIGEVSDQCSRLDLQGSERDMELKNLTKVFSEWKSLMEKRIDDLENHVKVDTFDVKSNPENCYSETRKFEFEDEKNFKPDLKQDIGTGFKETAIKKDVFSEKKKKGAKMLWYGADKEQICETLSMAQNNKYQGTNVGETEIDPRGCLYIENSNEQEFGKKMMTATGSLASDNMGVIRQDGRECLALGDKETIFTGAYKYIGTDKTVPVLKGHIYSTKKGDDELEVKTNAEESRKYNSEPKSETENARTDYSEPIVPENTGIYKIAKSTSAKKKKSSHKAVRATELSREDKTGCEIPPGVSSSVECVTHSQHQTQHREPGPQAGRWEALEIYRRSRAVAEHQRGLTEPRRETAEHQTGVAVPRRAVAEHQTGVAVPRRAVAEHQRVVGELRREVAEPWIGVAEPRREVAEPWMGVAEPRRTGTAWQDPKALVNKHLFDMKKDEEETQVMVCDSPWRQKTGKNDPKLSTQKDLARTSAPEFNGPLEASEMRVGVRVMRGPNWCCGDVDAPPPALGTVVMDAHLLYGFVTVRWDNGHVDKYKMGFDNMYQLRLANTAAAGV